MAVSFDCPRAGTASQVAEGIQVWVRLATIADDVMAIGPDPHPFVESDLRLFHASFKQLYTTFTPALHDLPPPTSSKTMPCRQMSTSRDTSCQARCDAV